MNLLRPVAVVAAALLLAACGSEPTDDDPVSSSAPTSVAPTEETSTPAPDDTASETAGPSTSPTPTGEPSEAPAEGGNPGTELPQDVLLPAGSLEPADGPRAESEGVVDWVLPAPCSVGAPSTALAMRSVAQGDGALEAPVGHHQVAVFADTDAAVAEASRIGETLTGCTGAAPDDGSRTVAEPVEVGAQGRGLVVDYHGTFAASGDEGALGYYTAVTRRGNTVTLVASVGGESTVSASREVVVGELAAAWELLCYYDADGC